MSSVRNIAFGLAVFASASLLTVSAQANGPRPSWTGFYVGVEGGLDGSSVDWNFTRFANATADHKGTGKSIGVTGGYNLQVGGILVVGVEAAISRTNLNGKSVCPSGGFDCQHELTALGSVRGRVGFLATPSLLVFATGGWGFGSSEYSIVSKTTGLLSAPSASISERGSVFGAGIEYKLTGGLSLKGEYLHYNFGGQTHPNGTVAATTGPIDTGLRVDTVRIGLNYGF